MMSVSRRNSCSFPGAENLICHFCDAILMDTRMGVATGRGGDGAHVPRFEILGDVPPEIAIFKKKNLKICQNFQLSKIFKLKLPKSEEKSEFGGRRF